MLEAAKVRIWWSLTRAERWWLSDWLRASLRVPLQGRNSGGSVTGSWPARAKAGPERTLNHSLMHMELATDPWPAQKAATVGAWASELEHACMWMLRLTPKPRCKPCSLFHGNCILWWQWPLPARYYSLPRYKKWIRNAVRSLRLTWPPDWWLNAMVLSS